MTKPQPRTDEEVRSKLRFAPFIFKDWRAASKIVGGDLERIGLLTLAALEYYETGNTPEGFAAELENDNELRAGWICIEESLDDVFEKVKDKSNKAQASQNVRWDKYREAKKAERQHEREQDTVYDTGAPDGTRCPVCGGHVFKKSSGFRYCGTNPTHDLNSSQE